MSPQAILEQLRSATPLIAPSMLKCDFSNLHREVELLEAAGARMLHLDVMDGHFVPNLSYGPMVIKQLRETTSLPFDAHLMIAQPERYLNEFLDAGCELITFHVETVSKPAALLQTIRDSGAAAGVALNPDTPVESVAECLSLCDLVLVMSVEPGFGGQQFNPSALDKLRRLKAMLAEGTLLSIDGGVGPSSIGQAAQAGADLFVVGSAIFDEPDYCQAIGRLAKLAQDAQQSPALTL